MCVCVWGGGGGGGGAFQQSKAKQDLFWALEVPAQTRVLHSGDRSPPLCIDMDQQLTKPPLKDTGSAIANLRRQC